MIAARYSHPFRVGINVTSDTHFSLALAALKSPLRTFAAGFLVWFESVVTTNRLCTLGLDVRSAHQMGYRVLSNPFSLINQLTVNPRCSIDLPAFNMRLPDLCKQISVSLWPDRSPAYPPNRSIHFGIPPTPDTSLPL